MDNSLNITIQERPQILVVGSTPLLIGTGITLAISSLAIVLNLSITITFLRDRRLVDAFTIHVLNLTIINLGAGLLLVFCFIPLHNFNSSWLSIRTNCAIYRFFTFFAAYMVIHQHFVICSDRWIALLAPLWYHNRRDVKYGWMATMCFVCSGCLWTVAVVSCEFMIPLPPDTYCSEPLPTIMLSVAITVAVLVPQGFIYVSYPFLLSLVWKRINVRRRTTRFEQVSLVLLDTNTCPSSPADHGNVILNVAAKSTGGSHMEEKRVGKRASNRHTSLVAWLAMAQILLWLPNTVIQLCRLEFAPLYTEDVVTSLSLLGSWLLLADPVIYLVFFPELLKGTMKTLGLERCRQFLSK